MTGALTDVLAACIALTILDVVLLLYMVLVRKVKISVIWDEFKNVNRILWSAGWGKK